MNSIQDYDPDQHENEDKYWDLAKRICKLEKEITKNNKPDEDDGTEVECDSDVIDGMTDKWVFDQLELSVSA